MWQVNIELDRQQADIVTAYDDEDNFSYSEKWLFGNINIENFVQSAIAKRDKWKADKNSVWDNAQTLSQDITNALNKADGVEDVELSIVAENGVIQCAKKVEAVEPAIIAPSEKVI